MKRAWFTTPGAASARQRPSLGQPVSPITIFLPGNSTAIRRYTDSTWSIARSMPVGSSSQYGSRCTLTMSTCAATWGNCSQNSQHLAVGHGLADGGAHLVDVGDEFGHRQVAAQQHLVADDDADDGVGVAVGVGDRARHFAFILRAVGAEPDALPDFQPVLLRERRHVVVALDRRVGADGAHVAGEQREVGIHLGRGGKPAGERRLAGAIRRVRDGIEFSVCTSGPASCGRFGSHHRRKIAPASAARRGNSQGRGRGIAPQYRFRRRRTT